MKARVSLIVIVTALLTIGVQAQVGATPRSCIPLKDVANDPTAGDKDHPVCVSSGVLMGNLEHRVLAHYPEEAWKAKVSDNVVVRVIINPQGTIDDVTVISGPEILRESWIEAYRQWTFKPYVVDGRAIYVAATMSTHVSHGAPPQDDIPSQIAAAEKGVPVGTRDNPAKVSSGVLMGNLEHRVTPIFPAAAKQDHVNGMVVMKALIDDQGNVTELSIISGPKVLQQPYMDAVRQWKYKPYLLNGKPAFVVTTISIHINFGG